MSGTAPEIPGFQPLHIRGGGELGIWIEARQVRLDRRVLLKVLPASESHLADDFQREVQGMVQLDGCGSLRVIEEGQVGQARFVALDEAGGVRPQPGQLSEAEIYPLATMLLSLYLETAAIGLRPGRIPVESLRRLPAGGFAVCELGRVQSLPIDSAVDDCRASVSETLRRWSRHLEFASAAEPLLEELRLEQIPLTEIRDKWNHEAEENVGKSNSIRFVTVNRTLLVLGICLLAGVVIRDLFFEESADFSRQPEIKSVADSQSSAVSVEDGGDPENQHSAEIDDGSGNELAGGEPVGGDEAEIHRETPLEVSAEDWEKAQLQGESWQVWTQIHGRVDPGNLLESRNFLQSVPVEVESFGVIRRALLWQELRFLRSTEKEIDEQISTGKFVEAKQLLEQMISLFPERKFHEVETLITAGQQRLKDLSQQWKYQQRVLLETLVSTGSLPSGQPSDFEGLRDEHPLPMERRRFLEKAEEVLAVHERVLEQLKKEMAEETSLEIRLPDGSKIKGRVLEVSSSHLVIKPLGRREGRVLTWSDIDRSWGLEKLAHDGMTIPERINSEEAMLSLVWGGLERVDAGEELGNLPAPLLSAVIETRKLRRTDAFRMLQEAGLEQQRDPLRSKVEELAGRFPQSDWSREEKRQLEEWWITPGLSGGPQTLDLFSGASDLQWREGAGGYEIEVSWNSGDGIAKDWGGVNSGEIQRARGGGVLLRGDISLEMRFVFEDHLRVQLDGSVTFRERPNLNVVFWTGGEVPLIFGLGLRPPRRASFTSAGETVLLPAHGIFKAPEIELPDTQAGEGPLPFPLPVVAPRLDPGKALRMEMADHSGGTSLNLGGQQLLQLPGEIRSRRGGISFRTFESPVMIRAIKLEAGVSSRQWRSVLLEEAQNTLWNGH